MRSFHCSSVADVTVATNQSTTTTPLLEKTDVVVVGESALIARFPVCPLISMGTNLPICVYTGNGPSALTLSFLLNGNWPYYDGEHPDEILHARLSYEKEKSILEMVGN